MVQVLHKYVHTVHGEVIAVRQRRTALIVSAPPPAAVAVPRDAAEASFTVPMVFLTRLCTAFLIAAGRSGQAVDWDNRRRIDSGCCSYGGVRTNTFDLSWGIASLDFGLRIIVS